MEGQGDLCLQAVLSALVLLGALGVRESRLDLNK